MKNKFLTECSRILSIYRELSKYCHRKPLHDRLAQECLVYWLFSPNKEKTSKVLFDLPNHTSFISTNIYWAVNTLNLREVICMLLLCSVDAFLLQGSILISLPD